MSPQMPLACATNCALYEELMRKSLKNNHIKFGIAFAYEGAILLSRAPWPKGVVRKRLSLWGRSRTAYSEER